MRRTRIKSRSRKRVGEGETRVDVRMALNHRDGGRCLLDRGRDEWPQETVDLVAVLGACYGPPTSHHVQKSSQSGGYTLTNLVTLCSSHNDAVELEPYAAHDLGLVVRSGDTIEGMAERRRERGLRR